MSGRYVSLRLAMKASRRKGVTIRALVLAFLVIIAGASVSPASWGVIPGAGAGVIPRAEAGAQARTSAEALLLAERAASPPQAASALEFRGEVERATARIAQDMARFGTLFPHVGKGSVYQLIGNRDWTCGFWTGLLWLSYRATGDGKFLEKARDLELSFYERLNREVAIDHDLGFLYSLSAVADYKLTGNEAARELGLRAARLLRQRFNPRGKFIQAWGEAGDPVLGGRAIIDTMMNLPLLFWASQESGDPSFGIIAGLHLNTVMRYLVREDGSTYHVFDFDQVSGAPIRGGTKQGYSPESCWSRGQAWAIYGFALAHHYTGRRDALDFARKTADYLIAHLPPDGVPPWDFSAPGEEEPRDTSAGAIAAAGLIQLAEELGTAQEPGADSRDSSYYRAHAERLLTQLMRRYSALGTPSEEGLLRHAIYSFPQRSGVGEYAIWGDYFYVEALMRVSGYEVEVFW